MKKTILLAALTVLLATSAQAEKKKTWVMTKGRVIILSDIRSPEFRMFLSYAGTWIDQCGIAIKTNFGVRSGPALAKQIEVIRQSDGQSVGRVAKDSLAADIPHPEGRSYGENFIVKTKNGKNLDEVFASMSDTTQVEVVAENLKCEDVQSKF